MSAPALALALALAGCGPAAWSDASRRPGRSEVVVFDDGPVPLGGLLARSDADATLASLDCEGDAERPLWHACRALPEDARRWPAPQLAQAGEEGPNTRTLARVTKAHDGDAAWWYGPERAQLGAWASREAGLDGAGRALATTLLEAALDPPGRRVALVVPAPLRALVEARAQARADCLVLDPRAFLEGE
ncbi:MAG: hypothetical protein AAF447_05890 [Myxococcota bacterium]